MLQASQIHAGLLSNNVDADDFFLENFEFIQGMLTHGSQGVGAFTDAWSRQMERIKTTLLDIEKLHQKYLRSGSIADRDKFYAERTLLFTKLGAHLDKLSSYGSGLSVEGIIKRILNISTKSYLKTGEIAGYAQKVDGVARAAKLIKRGTYVGTALDVGATALKIQKACAEGREAQCTRAKYVETSSFAFGLGGGVAGGALGASAATLGCVVVLGLATGGPGALACGVIGGLVGGIDVGEFGSQKGEQVGDYLYRKSLQ